MADDNEEFYDYLAEFSDRLEAVLKPVLIEQAQKLSDAQRAALRSLEQPPEETGDLEESCQVIEGAHELEFFVVAGGDLTTGDVREGSGVSYDHALAFEYGNSRQPARSFFFSTYRAMHDEMQAAIDDAVNEALK